MVICMQIHSNLVNLTSLVLEVLFHIISSFNDREVDINTYPQK